MNEILVPTTTTIAHEGSELINYEFSEGTKVTDVRLAPGDSPLRTIQNPNGTIVKDPSDRYPSRKMVAAAALEHFDQTGQLPPIK